MALVSQVEWVASNVSLRIKEGLQVGENKIIVTFPFRKFKKWIADDAETRLTHELQVDVLQRKKTIGRSLFQSSRVFNLANHNNQLIQYTDSIGTSFYFHLNGRTIYAKGVNWIPADMSLPRVTKDEYRKSLLKAKHANMNMLRVWGGGIYEDDYFYYL